MVRFFSGISYLTLLLNSCLCLNAQQEWGGSPLSSQYLLEAPPTSVFQMPPLEEIYRQDRENPEANRFAIPIKVDLDPGKVGVWDSVSDGSQIWRMEIVVPGARGLLLLYDQFKLVNGSQLFVYDPEKKEILGSYTEKNNTSHGKFLTGIISGERTILEYVLPKGREKADLLPSFHVTKIMAVYQRSPSAKQQESDFQTYQNAGYGDALPCHVNINCPEGDNWQEEKKGVVRILRVFEEGTGWCTGSLINNTMEDGHPYLLTAFHCIETPPYTPDFDLWRFDFNFEYSSCSDGNNQPSFQSILGCQAIAGRPESDFALLEIPYGIPYRYQPVFNGWNRSEMVPSNGTIIHHPYGDVKKIARDIHQLSIYPDAISWNNGVTTPANHHFKAVLDIGTIEGGSSGAPIFNGNGQIVGQLHGGNANCTNFLTFNGRLNKSWSEGDTSTQRLKEWLDPAQTNTQSLNAWSPSDTLPIFKGFVRDAEGKGISMVQVVRGGVDTVFTDSTGAFTLFDIPLDTSSWVRLSKTINTKNGVSTIDMVNMQKHILGVELFQNPYQYVAADVNLSGTVTTADQLEILKVILGVALEFPQAPSWQFFPDFFYIYDIPVHATSVLIPGVKTGDVNFSADPTQ